LSEISIKQKLASLGINLPYSPEQFGNSMVSLVLPVGDPKITPEQATSNFELISTIQTGHGETRRALAKAREIIEKHVEQQAKPKVIVESPSGSLEKKDGE
jgi:hypothetical protein